MQRIFGRVDRADLMARFSTLLGPVAGEVNKDASDDAKQQQGAEHAGDNLAGRHGAKYDSEPAHLAVDLLTGT